jgi:hypothetical protein
MWRQRVGGQTPIFHALTNHANRNSKVGQLRSSIEALT